MGPAPDLPLVAVSARALRHAREGYPWIYSNELKHPDPPLAAGTIVRIADASGHPAATAFYHPHSLIALRILSLDGGAAFDVILRDRLRGAAGLREALLPGNPFYRLVHGESDGLPGLIIDRYGEAYSLQAVSAGMDRHTPEILSALEELFHPELVVERNDSSLRDAEGLPRRKGILAGRGPAVRLIREGEAEFEVDLLEGQKTGFFYDQREARAFLAGTSQGTRVLDLFCCEGAFAIRAAKSGAANVLGIDASDRALERARKNAEINGVQERCEFIKDDVFETLARLRGEERKFDRVVVDPPSFAHSRKEVPGAKKAYLRLNAEALALVESGGIVITASCSHHIFADTFQEVLQEAAVRANVSLQVLATLNQAPDHPVLLSMPESQYLKVLVCRVLPR
ncbi:MAG: class I SAM-dependent rRNA methyltransferase [Nitrospirae bacterium]|nr:class I SAM-dependent rRNA methyltransferase [Nitrospirota bacterium]